MTIAITNEGNKWTGVINGRIDTTNTPQFEKDIQPLIEHADGEIDVDCTAMDYISSSGLRVFLTLRKAVMAQGGTLVVRNLAESPREVFMITGFYNLFTIK